MKCPVCQRESFGKHRLEANLPALKCTGCKGIWIPAAGYWAWLESQGEHRAKAARAPAPIPMEVAGQAKLCPDCGHFLRRYKVWPDVPFYLDRCGHCTGVWFDQGEWRAIRSRDLHRQVHLFFSDMWQDDLKEKETRRRFEKVYRDRFGDEDYARIKEIRAWLEQHPQRGALIAYLSDKDPYKALSS